MALVFDTGPLFASLDQRDADHQTCANLILNTSERCIIPAPVLVEVDYWIGQRLRPSHLVGLLNDINQGAFVIEDLEPNDYIRVAQLVERYADSDIGFVDAAVLAIVERLGETKLATLDRRHFSLLRPRHVDALRLLPE